MKPMTRQEELDRVEYLLANELWENEQERAELRRLHISLLDNCPFCGDKDRPGHACS